MAVARDPEALARQARAWRGQGERIALVPTMGALHAGHLSLLRLAARQAERVIVSIFVNPAQFGPGEDYARYPRCEEQDLALLREHGAALAYLPAAEAMYPEGFGTMIHISGLTEILCGAHRPGHFDGVATAVAKLLLQAMPDAAFFGEKDYQQLQVIKRMVKDLNIPVSIASGPIVREPDGLALSSRNRYLSAEERKAAPALFSTLRRAAERLRSGALVAEEISGWGVWELQQAGFGKVDYFELRGADSLPPLPEFNAPARLLAAAFLGTTRLIDNIPVEP